MSIIYGIIYVSAPESLYTKKLLHIEAFTHILFYTKKPIHRNFDTQTCLHRGVLTQGPQKSLYTEKS